MKFACVEDYEKEAKKRLDKMALDFIADGAFSHDTLKENKNSFKLWHIRPRVLRDVSKRDLSTFVMGQKIAFPVGAAPVGLQQLTHAEGECATARATSSAGTIYTLSTYATSSIEKVAEETPNGMNFFQIYTFNNRDVVERLVNRAEKAGYKALVMTVDANCNAMRYSNMRNNFELPNHFQLLGASEYYADTSKMSIPGGRESYKTTANSHDHSLSWKDVEWFKSLTSMPLIIKGIQTKEDALMALQAGVSAIWVSNHGGRQCDGSLCTMEALHEVSSAVQGRCDIYVDGGFSSGTDVFKALALGANMVFLGRAMLWGLTCEGEDGAKNILEIMKNELDCVMALAGCSTIGEIRKEMVYPAGMYSKI